MNTDNELNLEDPDYYIEDFWYGFKKSIMNFYTFIKFDYSHIEAWSTKLNLLKSQKKYTEIEIQIRHYMSIYAFDLINYSKSTYHDLILITNIKRWNKISQQFNFQQSKQHSKIILLFSINLEIKKNEFNKEVLKKMGTIFNNFNLNKDTLIHDNLEYILNTNDYNDIIIYALENQKSKILELLKQIHNYDIYANIKQIYPDFTFRPNLKISNLCQQFKNQ